MFWGFLLAKILRRGLSLHVAFTQVTDWGLKLLLYGNLSDVSINSDRLLFPSCWPTMSSRSSSTVLPVTTEQHEFWAIYICENTNPISGKPLHVRGTLDQVQRWVRLNFTTGTVHIERARHLFIDLTEQMLTSQTEFHKQQHLEMLEVCKKVPEIKPSTNTAVYHLHLGGQAPDDPSRHIVLSNKDFEPLFWIERLFKLLTK